MQLGNNNLICVACGTPHEKPVVGEYNDISVSAADLTNPFLIDLATRVPEFTVCEAARFIHAMEELGHVHRSGDCWYLTLPGHRNLFDMGERCGEPDCLCTNGVRSSNKKKRRAARKAQRTNLR